MKISYLSDLHIEFEDFHDFSNEKGGDILILAGDIVTANKLGPLRTDKTSLRIKKQLSLMKKNLFDKYSVVYYVMGNHEHYGSIFDYTKNSLEEGFSHLDLNEKIKILDNDCIQFDEFTLLGGSLWTNYNNGNDGDMYICGRGMNDYRWIGMRNVNDINYFNKHQSHNITPEFILGKHKETMDFFKACLENPSDKPVVIVTHHGPTYKSLNRDHSGNGLDPAFCSDLSEFILDNPRIKYWIHGHTHANLNYMVGECRVLANQRGYYSEKSCLEFKGTKDFEI